MFGRKSNMCVTNMSIFQPLEILDRGNETQPQVVENWNKLT